MQPGHAQHPALPQGGQHGQQLLDEQAQTTEVYRALLQDEEAMELIELGAGGEGTVYAARLARPFQQLLLLVLATAAVTADWAANFLGKVSDSVIKVFHKAPQGSAGARIAAAVAQHPNTAAAHGEAWQWLCLSASARLATSILLPHPGKHLC